MKILDFWSQVVTNLPSSWEKCSVFQHTSAQILFPRTKRLLSGAEKIGTLNQSSSNAQLVPVSKEMDEKLTSIALHISSIHPQKYCGYDEWIKIFFATHGEMNNEHSTIVHRILDNFSIVRDSYKDFDDIVKRYNGIKSRLASEKCITIKNIDNISDGFPALVLTSQPTVNECADLQTAMKEMWGKDDAETAIRRQNVQQNIVGMLFTYVDVRNTDGRWLIQLCSNLVGGREESYTTALKNLIVQKYRDAGIEVLMHDIDNIWKMKKCIYYQKGIIGYARVQLMKKSDQDYATIMSASDIANETTASNIGSTLSNIVTQTHANTLQKKRSGHLRDSV